MKGDLTTGKLVENLIPDEETAKAGQFSISQNEGSNYVWMQFICPCPDKLCNGVLRISEDEKIAAKRHTWLWDGNREKPTLTPSIARKGGCGWHGYLEKGIWREV